MCGRVTQLANPKELEERYNRKSRIVYDGPNYNAAPGQMLPAVSAKGIFDMHFGLVPQWAQSLKDGYKFINARAETLLEKRTYKGLVKQHRCLIPAAGFYEWQNVDGKKVPYYFTVKNRPLFSLAGLWTSREDSEGHELLSFTIITTEPNELVGKIHDRMPVILDKDEEEAWLDESITDPAEVMPLLDSYPASKMKMEQASPLVNNVRNNNADLIKPVNSK